MPKQNIMMFSMLEGTDGRKMSTSWNNIITIVDEPFDMFGKIMAINDAFIIRYFMLCTDLSLADIQTHEIELTEGANPKDIKMKLAVELVTLYHNEKEAALAKNSWVETFEKGGVPETIPEIFSKKGEELVTILIEASIVSSKTDWRRLVVEGAVTDTNKKEEGVITDPKQLAYSTTFKIGKKRFVQVTVEDTV